MRGPPEERPVAVVEPPAIGEHPDRIALDRLLGRWLPGVEVGRRAHWQLRQHFIAIGSALGVVDSMARLPFEYGTLEHQVQVIAMAADAFARRVGGLTPGIVTRPDFSWVRAGGAMPIPGVVPARLVDRLDVNAATLDELQALPGLGPTSARRIVVRRAGRGLYLDLAQVRAAAGVTPTVWERTAPHVRVGDGRVTSSTSDIDARLRGGGMTALLALWEEGRLEVPALTGATTRIEALVVLMTELANELRLSPLFPPLWAPSRDRLRRAQVAQRRDAELVSRAARSEVRAAPVFSGGYLPLLTRLLQAAQQQVLVSMFYFNVGEAQDLGDPGDRLVDELVAARSRGVDVRLILDDDLPEDRHRARAVNRAAVAVLAERGIPLRLDHLEVTSHAKLLVVDRRLVLVGSHNWTASSFFRYQEAGCLVDSNELGVRTAALLERRWQLLAPAQERVVPVEQSQLLDSAQRDAVVAAGLEDGPAFRAATRLAGQRRDLAPILGVTADELLGLTKVVRLMQSYRISEPAAVALVVGGLDSPSAVARATSTRLRKVLGQRSALGDPFGLPEVLPAFADWLARQTPEGGP